MNELDSEPGLQSGSHPTQRMNVVQHRMTSQNNDLISSLERADEDPKIFEEHTGYFLDEDIRDLKESDSNPHVRAMIAEGRLDEAKSELDIVESQLKTMTMKNKELFSLFEQEEAKTSEMTSELKACKNELQCLQTKYNVLTQASGATEFTATNAVRENKLKTDEIRLLRTEVDQLKQQNSELRIKSTVEVEALEEQLRLRKEKQYQLVGKLQSQEEACRHSDDRVNEMEQEIRNLHLKSSELQTALQLETSARLSQDNNNRSMAIDIQGTSTENNELRTKLQDAEQVRLKLEAEARDNGSQLREMAEKVFQLLERLKLAELSKKKAAEALGKRDHELFTLRKQHTKIIEDNINQKKINEQTESKRLLVEDQLRGLQKVNSQLCQKLKDETKTRMCQEESCNEAKEKVRILDGRLAFLLNKLQTDEEARSVQQEDVKKMESQLQITTQRCETLQTKLNDAEVSARVVADKLQHTEHLLNEIQIKNQSIEQTMKEHEENVLKEERKSIQSKEKFNKIYSGGHTRFFVDNKLSMRHVAITGKCPKDKVWIDETGCNSFLRKILKSQNAQELLIKRLAEMYGLLLCGEEQLEKVSADLKAREEVTERINHELIGIQGDVLKEEDSKRRILLRYIRAVKASASLGETGCEEDRKEVGGVGAGRINLPESSLGDEEIHIVAAMLRNNVTIEELQFRRNYIGDDGAMALAAVLADRSGLKLIDLRENRVSINGVKAIAEALERSERVHKVVVHQGGKIEAFGASASIIETESNVSSVKTICIVDLRDNQSIVEEALKKSDGTKPVIEGRRTRSNSEKKRRQKKGKTVRASSADAAEEGEGCRETRSHSAKR